MPFCRAAALMRVTHRRRKSRFLLRRSRSGEVSAVLGPSLAFLCCGLASPRKPFARSRTARRFFFAWMERLTRVIVLPALPLQQLLDAALVVIRQDRIALETHLALRRLLAQVVRGHAVAGLDLALGRELEALL